MYQKNVLLAVLLAIGILGNAVAQADTNLILGGDITSAGGWDNGKPSSDNPGTVAVDGISTVTTFGYGADGVINHTSGDIVCNGTNGFNMVQSGTWNMSGGSITGRYILSNGQQGNCAFNFSGGTAILSDVDGTQHMGVANGGTMSVSGSFSVDGTPATVEVQAIDGIIDILSGWTGSWTWGTYSGFDWKDIVTAGAGENGFRLNGAMIDAATFDATFQITDGGQTLSMIAVLAYQPDPADGQTDVLRDADLGWEPGEYAATHNVYFGTIFDDVNTATVPTAEGLDVNSFDPERLDFGKTYFWRVDEVNGTPDKTVYRGNVWSFTAEPYSIQIPGPNIIATASSSSNDFSKSDKTVDGSGLGENDTHDIKTETMWFTAMGDMDPWIQYEFDGVKKLDVTKVWNSNSAAEGFIGYGAKDVLVEYSTDGQVWETLEDANEFSRAPGLPTYNQYDEIDFGGAAAKMVRINIQSNFGGFMQAYSISEVQFSMIPAAARTPKPASGSVDILPNAVVSWRAGREAGQSTVYLSTDPNEVADGIAASATSSTNSINLSAFDAELGQTYYWRVDEVNEAEVESVWAGPVWSFSTVEAIVVDDFESYTNDSPDRPFQTWLDGFGYSADEFYPAGYGGNGTGAGIGHDIWTVASEYYNGDIMETGITIAGSLQSMPFYYTNSGTVASETKRTFAVPQDWTMGGAKLLNIAFFGEAENTGTLYAKINGVKVTYSEPEHIAARTWKTWNIDLSALGITPQSITTLAIGVDGNGASGMFLIDDITLRQTPPEPLETVSRVNDFDSLAAGSSMHDVPGWEGWYGGAQLGAKVTDTVAYSGTHSLEIVGTRDDVVPNWPRVENGVYVATVMQYVPTGTDGLMYFGPLSAYGSNSSTWLGTLLSNCSTGLVYVDDLTGGRTEAPLLRDQWVQLRVVMNFDANACDFYYSDTLLGTLECPSVMGFDIWPDDDVDILYYDDFSFQAQ